MASKPTSFKDWYEQNKDHPKLLDAYKIYAEKTKAKGERPEPKILWASERYHQITEARDRGAL